MGAAKRRGTKEERIAKAIALREAERPEKERLKREADAEAWRNLGPDGRKSALTLASALAVVAGTLL